MHPRELHPAIGPFVIEPGDVHDYLFLERFHYRPGAPSTRAQTWVVRGRHDEPIAVGVLSYSVPSLRERDGYFGLSNLTRARRIEFVNVSLRTISRVIVHPQYRALGLAGRLVRHLCRHAPTRYVESIAMMARAHPLFERAGMRRIGPDEPDRAPYFLWDRRQIRTCSFNLIQKDNP